MRLMFVVLLAALLAAGFIAWRAGVQLAAPEPLAPHAAPATTPSPPGPTEPRPTNPAPNAGRPRFAAPPVDPAANQEPIAQSPLATQPLPGRVVWARNQTDAQAAAAARLAAASVAFANSPTSDAALQDAAAAATAAQRWADLVDIYTRAVETVPDDLDRRAELAAAQMRLRLWTLAIDQLRVVVAGRPGDRRAAYNLAIALSAAARLHEACAAWDRVITLGTDADALARRGEVRMDLGDWRDAANDLDAALKLAPDSIDTVLNLATALEHGDRLADAEGALGRFVAQAPKCVPVLVRYAEVMDRARQSLVPQPEGIPDRDVRILKTCNTILALQPGQEDALRLRTELELRQSKGRGNRDLNTPPVRTAMASGGPADT